MKRLYSGLSWLVAVAVAASLLGPVNTRASRTHAGFNGTIKVFAMGYNPPNVGPENPNNPPHHALEKIAATWERSHPGIKVRFTDIGVPGQDYYTVLRARLTGGTAPDIFWFQPRGDIGGNVNQFLQAGLILNLRPYLMKANKYIKGNKRWNDSFRSPWQTFGRTQAGQYGAVPIDLVSTGVFYNRSILKRAHVQLPPKTWAEFMKDLQKLKTAGYLPFSAGGGLYQDWWYWGSVSPQFLLPLVPKLAVLKYHPGFIPGYVTAEDWVRGVVKLGWRPSKDPRFVADIRVFKAWAKYFNPGFSDANAGNPDQLFARGQVAMDWNATPLLPILKKENVKFPIGSFWLPPITRATSKYAPAKPFTPTALGGYGSNAFAVPATLARSKSKLAAVIDLLKYISAPTNNSKIVNEHPAYVPAVIGAKGNKSIARLFKGFGSLKKTAGNIPIVVTDSLAPDDYTKWFRYQILYLQGSTSEQDFLKQVDGLVVHSAQELIAQNDIAKNKSGTWDLTKW